MLLRRMLTRLQGPEDAPAGGGGTPTGPASTAPTPSAAPAASSVSAAEAASGPRTDSPASAGEGTPVDDFDFGALVDNANAPDDGGVAVAPKAVPAPVPAVVPPAPVVAAAPVAPVSPPQAQPPGQPPVAASTPQTATPEPPTPPVEPFDVAKHRQEFLPKLAKLYEMTPEEVAELSTNPGEAMPKLAAKLHYEVQLATHQAILQILPSLMGNHMEHERTRTRGEESFYTRWPELKEAVGKDIKVEASINEAIRSYRALNPKATMQELTEKAGLLAMITLGIQPRGAAPQAPAQPVVTPQAPTPIPGRPAGTGASAHVPVPANSGSRREQDGADLYAAIADNWTAGGG